MPKNYKHQKIIMGVRPGLDTKKRKEFEELVNFYAQDIVDKWVVYFVKKKPVTPKILIQKVSCVRAIN